LLKIGHRGAPGAHRFQENTLASFQRALLCGADAIEFDVRRTADGQLVVFHDAYVQELTGVKGTLSGMTLRSVRALRVHGEPIPMLSDVFYYFGSAFAVLNVELKDEGIQKETLRSVKKHNLERKTLISSFRWKELMQFRMEPAIKTALLIDKRKDPQDNITAIIDKAKRIGASCLNIEQSTIELDIIEKIHSAELLAYIWVVNRRTEIEKYKRWGVDGIFSDFPSLL